MFEKKHRYIAVLKNIDSIDSDIDVFASLVEVAKVVDESLWKDSINAVISTKLTV